MNPTALDTSAAADRELKARELERLTYLINALDSLTQVEGLLEPARKLGRLELAVARAHEQTLRRLLNGH